MYSLISCINDKYDNQPQGIEIHVKKDKKRVFSKWWGLILPCLLKQRMIDVILETLKPNPQWDQDRTHQGSQQQW